MVEFVFCIVQDLALKCVGDGLDVNTTLASAIMTRNPTYVSIDSSAVDALQKMIQGTCRPPLYGLGMPGGTSRHCRGSLRKALLLFKFMFRLSITMLASTQRADKAAASQLPCVALSPLLMTNDGSSFIQSPFSAGRFRHLPVIEDGEVVALLDITKCLYDAIARMEKAAEKGHAIAAAMEGVGGTQGNIHKSQYVH